MRLLSKLRARIMDPTSSTLLFVSLGVGVVVVATFIVIGLTHATGVFVANEAESGTVSGNATIVADTNASGGRAVQFNSPAINPGSPSCALPNYPKPNCTGVPAGTSLQTIQPNNPPDNDAYIVTTPGAVIDSKHIMGHLIIRADNVVIKNSQIEGDVDNEQSTGSGSILHPYTITDSTVTAPTCQTAPGLASANYTATRIKILMHDDGFRVSTPGNVTITDSFAKMCWNPPSLAPPDGSHSGGLQATCGDGTCYNTVFNHNTIDNSQPNANSGITMQSCTGLNQGCGTDNPISGVTANDNLIFGGGYNIIFWWTTGPHYEVHNNRLVNKSAVFDPVDTKNTCSSQNWSGNTLVTVDGYTPGQEYDWAHGTYNVTSTVGPQGCVN